MFKLIKKTTFAIAAIATLGFALAACHKAEGPAEKAGKTLDNASSHVKDAVTPDGPAEKAGKKLDNAVGSN